LAGYRVQQVAWTATNALRIDLTAHLVRLDLGFHKAHPPGELIERVDGDVDALADFLSSFVVNLTGSVLLLIGVLITIQVEDVALGVIMAIFWLLALALLVRAYRSASLRWRADRECSARFWGSMGETLTATEDIQACGAINYATRRFLLSLQRWWPVSLRSDLWGMVWVVGEAAFIVATMLAWGIGGPLVQDGTLSLGTLYMIEHYLMLIYGSVWQIQNELRALQRAQVSIVRVRELLDTTSGLVDGEAVLPPGALSVEFDNVSFAYADDNGSMNESPVHITLPANDQTTRLQGNYILHDLSFQVRAGRVLGLLGRTGSGKTTISRLLFRWYDPQKGGIRLGGVDLRQAKTDALRARIGLVTQDVQLFEATLRDNLTFFDPAVSDQELTAVLEALGLAEWLARLPQGLNSPISGEALSAGEAQLVALARLFLKDPDLVILDEAASRVDPATEALLGRVLDRLLKGRSAVIVAHRLQTVDRADDILILEGGKAIEYGPRRQLTADPDSHFSRLLRTGIEEVLT
jgi:ABC-type multidrug transport system fused ATPase/permease subunit